MIGMDERERVGGLRFARYPPAAYLGAGRSPHLETGVCGEPDERVAPETLAADHRLEEIRPGAVRELEVDRKRRVEIGEGLEHHRDAVVARARELIEFDFSHGLLQLPDKGKNGVARLARAPAGRRATPAPGARRNRRSVPSEIRGVHKHAESGFYYQFRGGRE